MSSSAKVESNKPKSSKLRASCDTCFLAKVKCSKTRPICSRCLACGADCTYSPSSRAGKPKSGRRPAAQEPNHSVSALEESGGRQYPTPSMNIDVEQHSSYGMETDWSSVLGSPRGGVHPRPSIASTAMRGTVVGDETSSEPEANPGLFDPSFSWITSPRPEMASPYMPTLERHQHQHHHVHASQLLPGQYQPPNQPPNQQHQQHHQQPPPPPPQYQPNSRSKSLSAPVPIIPSPPYSWYQACGPDTPTSQLDIYLPSSNDSSPRPSSRSARCHCVPRCLAALHALHTADALPAGSPFDGILTTNQRAVDTCAGMLACPRCPSAPASASSVASSSSSSSAAASLRTMLLGTLLGRIVAVYQEASASYFARAANQLPLSLGSYRVAGADARWLQTEIILRDLEKLRELVARFRETGAGGERGADGGMHDAVTRFLCRSLDLTFDILRRQRGCLGEAASCKW
ncbi:hypothetical protein QTJ16_005752 [Diplocarpon rosae]|uniref:Zn(2)-C6 fungal-type domain-containing protein n=1 Tax=Diplocarpon rosae TaxID=946125 RepID=A0AAD9WD82_9HELO|nr:hypothetical protein QTJ16_005752 [Diplocarpon rosae]